MTASDSTSEPSSDSGTPGDTGDTSARPPAPGVDRKLLEILVCPLTKGPLRYDRERQELVSEQAGLAYPIRDGIPIMLVDEARRLDEEGGQGTTP
jgi:hypothetical protein